MPTTLERQITADELLQMGDIGRCELIYGELIMMSPAGAEHGVVASRIAQMVRAFVEAHDLGEVFAAETGFKLEANPDLVRAPDVSFIRKARLPAILPKGFFEGAPDLAVEVMSQGDTRRYVGEKVDSWLAHGTISVWVANPSLMAMTIYRTGQSPVKLTVEDQLQDESALPGFKMALERIFKRP